MVDLEELKARLLPITEYSSFDVLNLLATIAVVERLEALQKTFERLLVAVDYIGFKVSDKQ